MGSAVRHLAWRSAPLLVAGIVVALGGAAVAGGAIMIETSSHDAKAPRPTGPSVPGTSQARAPAAVGPSGGTDSITAVQVAPLRRIVPPDLLAISAKGITAAQLTKIKKLRHVRDVITADGGAIRLQSRLANVLGVDPSTFRSWTPPATAANERIWSSLAKNEFVLSTAAQARLRLHPGTSYQMAGATQALVPLGASATLGVPGVDALVSQSTSHVLGLVPNVAAMINAPGANIRTLISHVRAVLGPPSQIIDLDAAAGRLPVDSGVHDQPADQLSGPVPAIRPQVLPRIVLDGPRRDRADRERAWPQRRSLEGRGARSNAVPALDLADMGHPWVRRHDR